MDKAALLKPRFKEQDIDLEGVGTVRIRALTREEMLNIGAGAELPAVEFERKMLALAMVDPALSEDEVAQWQRASPAGEMAPILEAVNELSGIRQNAAKEAYKSVRGGRK